MLVRRERFDAAAMEHLALDRAPFEHAPLARLELVEPRREECLDRRGHDHLAARRVGQHRKHLLDEERVSLGGLGNARAQRAVELRSAEELLDQLVGLGGTQRLDQHRGRVELSPAPTGSPVEQLRPGQAE